MRRYAPYAAALLALALLAWALVYRFSSSRTPSMRTGSSHSDSAEAALPIPSARTLLTADDLRSLTGDEYLPSESPPDIPTMTQCAYSGPYEVSLWVVVGEGAPLRFASHAQRLGRLTEQGLGDQAVWLPENGTLAVLAGDRALQIDVRDPVTELNSDSIETRHLLSRAIAEHVLERLRSASAEID